jgi:DNA repair exonuclease SbcCD ATPase subunit
MNEKGVTIQDFLQIYQAASSQSDTLLVVIGIITTIFGIIVAIVIAFFAIRQINVDREIRKYRDEIKKQKEMAAEVVERMKIDLGSASSLLTEAKNTKNKLEEEIKKPSSSETKKEIEKLQRKIEKLEEDITYKRGALAATSGVVSGGISGVIGGYNFGDSLYSNVVTPWQEICRKCGKAYEKSINYRDSVDLINSSFTAPTSGSKCPYCGNVN